LRVIGETMQLLGGRPPGAAGGATEGAEAATESRPSKPAPPPKAGAPAEPDDDEIPF
jgi:single-stranded DNA-binding protein